MSPKSRFTHLINKQENTISMRDSLKSGVKDVGIKDPHNFCII